MVEVNCLLRQHQQRTTVFEVLVFFLASTKSFIEVLVQPLATSETVSGREEELERREESATIGDTAPKSDRLKVQQEVLRTEEGAEQPEEEDRLGSPCNLATSPPARLSTLTGEARRRVGGETPEEAGWTSEAKLTLGESGPGYMYRMEEGCCCCCSGKV